MQIRVQLLSPCRVTVAKQAIRTDRAIRTNRAKWFRLHILVGLAFTLTSCLSLDPEFISPNHSTSGQESSLFPGSDSGTISSSATGASSAGVMTTGGIEASEDTSSTTSDSESETVNDSTAGQGESGDSGTTTEGTNSTDGTSSTSDSETSSSETSTSETSSDSSESSSSDSGGTSDSSDTGTEPCVPQICHRKNDDQIVNDSKGTLNYIYGFPISFATDQLIVRAEVFTGKQSGATTFEIWSATVDGRFPNSLIETENWMISPQNGWQGTDFSSPTPANAGTKYWLVWSAPFDSLASIATTGQGLAVAASSDGGNQWITAASEFWMYRLYCCPAGL